MQREDGEGEGGGVGVQESTPLPKSSGKVKTAAGTELKEEKGEGLNLYKQRELSLKLCSSIPGGALVGKANPQEQSEVLRVFGGYLIEAVWPPHRQSSPSRPRRTTTFAGVGTRTLRVQTGARRVL